MASAVEVVAIALAADVVSVVAIASVDEVVTSVVVVVVVSAAFSPQAASRPRLATAASVRAVFILEFSVNIYAQSPRVSPHTEKWCRCEAIRFVTSAGDMNITILRNFAPTMPTPIRWLVAAGLALSKLDDRFGLIEAP